MAVVLLTGCAASVGGGRAALAPDVADRLFFREIAARLTLMEDVARAKLKLGKPIVDPEREKIVIADRVERGKAFGLDPDFVERFFKAQIAAGKMVQTLAVERDKVAIAAEGRPDRDLETEIRPELDKLDGEILESLAGWSKRPVAADTQRLAQLSAELIAGGLINSEIRSVAIRPLIELSLKDSTEATEEAPTKSP